MLYCDFTAFFFVSYLGSNHIRIWRSMGYRSCHSIKVIWERTPYIRWSEKWWFTNKCTKVRVEIFWWYQAKDSAQWGKVIRFAWYIHCKLLILSYPKSLDTLSDLIGTGDGEHIEESWWGYIAWGERCFSLFGLCAYLCFFMNFIFQSLQNQINCFSINTMYEFSFCAFFYCKISTKKVRA